MEKAVRQTIRQERLGAGDTVLCAVSGGADSVCLLHVLHSLQREAGFLLRCVHVHHGIRGNEADEDASFVRALCECLQIPFVLKAVDVPALADRSAHTGIEESARTARYQALTEEAERIAKRQKPAGDPETGTGKAPGKEAGRTPQVRIAVAHTLDDNAETVLFQLFRGTGLRGLAGIRPVNGPVIRPLLPVSRKAVEAYLTGHGISWRTDNTNNEENCARNRIRHSVLPEAVQSVNSRAKEHIAQTAGDMRELLRYLDERIAEAEARCLVSGTPEEYAQVKAARVFSVNRLRREDPFLRAGLIRQALGYLQEEARKGAYYQIGRVHVEAVLELIDRENGRAGLDLPGGVCAGRLHDNLVLFLSE